MATLYNVAQMMASDVAKSRIKVALLMAGDVARRELFIVGMGSEDEQQRSAKRKNAAKFILRTPHLALDMMGSRIMIDTSVLEKAEELVSTELEPEDESELDLMLIDLCDDVIDEFLNVIPTVS